MFPAVSGWVSEELCQLTDVEQELAELGETFRAELLRPGGLDLGNGFAERKADGRAAHKRCDLQVFLRERRDSNPRPPA